MIKPWTYVTVPKDKPLYIRRKGHPIGASLVNTISPTGVIVMVCNDMETGNKTVPMKITWAELAVTCEQYNGEPCGVKS